MKGLFNQIWTSIKVVIVTITICCVVYTLSILLIGQVLMPDKADGSLIYDRDGKPIGSYLIAQKFAAPKYIWPRPSAADYNAASSGASNLSPTNPELRKKAASQIAALGSPKNGSIPVDLVTASGSGLDPHITLTAALYQADRVASARGIPVEAVKRIIRKHSATDSVGFYQEPLINVVELNIALDSLR